VTFASNTWALLKDTVTGFIDDNALSRGASIAYYTLFSLAPVLLIIVAIAGLVFGHDAAEGAIVGQLNGLMGDATAKALEEMIKSADNRADGIVAVILGIAALIVTATGVFGEVLVDERDLECQVGSLDIQPPGTCAPSEPRPRRHLRLPPHRVAGGGAGLAALSKYLKGIFPGADVTLEVFDFVVSTALISGRFAAIYRCCPTSRSRGAMWRSARWRRRSCSRAASI
jgi:membrane protein